jgi:hypothetical protein
MKMAAYVVLVKIEIILFIELNKLAVAQMFNVVSKKKSLSEFALTNFAVSLFMRVFSPPIKRVNVFCSQFFVVCS